MPSPLDGLDDALGRVGSVLWLAVIASLAAAATTVVVLLALGLLGGLGRGRWPLTVAIVILLAGVLVALFGNGEWGPGGEARQHATFIVTLVGLNALFWTAWAELPEGITPTPAEPFFGLLAGICLLAIAGWLAYLGGLRRLGSLTG